MTYHGRIKNGQVVVDEKVSLPEGVEVVIVVTPQPQTEEEESEGPTLLERLKHFKGSAKNLPSDASKNVDHYLYGLPKK